MKQKIFNITIGTLAVFAIVGALLILQSKKNSDNLASQNLNGSFTTTQEQTDVLGESTKKSSIDASIANKNKLSDGSTEIEIKIAISNKSNSTIQFSPPIDFSVLDTITKSEYSLESSEKTTLFGGPIEPGTSLEGTVYVIIDSPIEQTNLQLLYQPNYSDVTEAINL